jgi:oligopeptide transport system permease protein
MAKFIARRALWMMLVLFMVSVVTFALMHAVPGGPFDRERRLPEQIIENLNRLYNLDAPLYQQYIDYMGAVLIPRVTTGELERSVNNDYLVNIPLPFGDQTTIRWMNFGPSIKSRNRTVNDIFREQLPISAQLGITALMVAIGIGVPLGTLAALKRNTIYDYASMGVAILGVSVPVITMGPIIRYLFGVQLRWLPVSGWGSIEHVILPAFALGFAQSALLARLTRASLLQVLNEDYIRTARAKGLAERAVIVAHALKNGMIPVVTIIGPLFALLVTGTFVVEQIFGIPGIGRYFITSVTNRDYPVIMGTILLYAFFLVVSNAAVDVIYAWLDPRIRYE